MITLKSKKATEAIQFGMYIIGNDEIKGKELHKEVKQLYKAWKKLQSNNKIKR